MANLFYDYLDYLDRPDPDPSQTPQTPMQQHMPNMMVQTTLFFSMFVMIYLYAPAIIRAISPQLYANIEANPEKRKELSSWTGSFLHHCIIVPYGIYMLIEDFNMNKHNIQYQNNTIDYGEALQHHFWIANFCVSYMMCDLVMFTAKEVLQTGNILYTIHHFLVIVLYRGLIQASGSILRFMPHFILCEITGIFFGLRWFVSQVGQKDRLFVKILEFSFAIFFFLTRILNLPRVVYSVFQLDSVRQNKKILYVLYFTLIPLIGFQFWWFYKIIVALKKKNNNTTTDVVDAKDDPKNVIENKNK